MEKIEELYETLKDMDEDRINNNLKDIVIIDGAIAQDSNLEYKKNMYLSLENKYKDELSDLNYDKIKDIVDVKVDKYVDSMIKSINTKLGSLKACLIRISGLKLYRDEKTSNILDEIKKEVNPKMVYKLYAKLDEHLCSNIK